MSFPSLRFQQSEVYEIPLTLPSLPISIFEMGKQSFFKGKSKIYSFYSQTTLVI